MHRYVALLRGIAPSLPNMSNDKLRGVFDGLGLGHVGSVPSSGNIVFRSPESDVAALERRIQRALNSELGIPGGTIVRELTEPRALLDSDPFPGLTHGPGTYLTGTFLKDGAAAAMDLPEQPEPRTRVVGYDASAPRLPRGHRQQRSRQDAGFHDVVGQDVRQGHHHAHLAHRAAGRGEVGGAEYARCGAGLRRRTARQTAPRLRPAWGLRGYDAVHTASAASVGSSDLVAVAGDVALLAAWQQLGLTTVTTS